MSSSTNTQNNTTYYSLGKTLRGVQIKVDHAIVKHFSEHLYSSPNKAIEELVSNSYDALATHCFVYIPGEHTTDKVVVWDNGISMDADQLDAMWDIARSPKEALGPGRIISAEGKERAVIGKFGIGKLASYAVGERISHFCRTKDGEYLAISVDYRSFAQPDDADSSSNTELSNSKQVVHSNSDRTSGSFEDESPQTEIRALTEEEMNSVISQALKGCQAVEFMKSQPHWTLAIIDDLRPNVSKRLYVGRLSWVLGNGMPLRPDFQVWVQDNEVRPKLATKSSEEWGLAQSEVVAALKNAWQSATDEGRVTGKLVFNAPNSSSTEPQCSASVEFPHVGVVTATIRIFNDSLAKYSEDHRSHGFFLMVRGRLINPDDDKLFLHDPSFGTFYRSQFVINADGLDAELLADRESLRRGTPMYHEIRVLQLGLYHAARSAIDRIENRRAKEVKSESRLPVRSRELYLNPMTALLSKAPTQPTATDLNQPKIDRKTLGERKPIADLEDATGHLQVNEAHPFYQVVSDHAGQGKRRADIMRIFDLIAVSECLTKGYLYTCGYPDLQIQNLFDWRDNLFRSLAQGFQDNPDEIVAELKTASYVGDERFENAITEVFRSMGFTAQRDGASGRKDVVVVAPIGPGHRGFTIEAKGSKDAVRNVTAAVASAARHRDEVPGATHALIVARQFAGFDRGSNPAILGECKSVGGVSLVTVDVLVALYAAVQDYAFPLNTIMAALFVLESPDDKLTRVRKLSTPLQDIDYHEILQKIWELQQTSASEDVVSIRQLFQSGYKASLKIEDFINKIVLLEHFARPLMKVDTNKETVFITQSPDHLFTQIENTIYASSDSPLLKSPAQGN